MESDQLEAFKVPSILLGGSALVFAVLCAIGTYITMRENWWQEQGHLHAFLLGSCLTILFLIYAILCYRVIVSPSLRNAIVVFRIQALLFLCVAILCLFASFIPAY